MAQADIVTSKEPKGALDEKSPRVMKQRMRKVEVDGVVMRFSSNSLHIDAPLVAKDTSVRAEYMASSESLALLENFGSFHPSKHAFVTMYHAPDLARIKWVKIGIGAREANTILGQLNLRKGEALNALKIPVATMNKKVKANAPLPSDEGERVLGLGRLLGQVQTMVQESGNPEGFDAAAWLSDWMSSPVPALGGTRPLDLMDTMTGQALVSNTLAQMQSGAYA